MSTGKARSERWRERRRNGQIALTINVTLDTRWALEAMGLIEPGHHQDREAVTWAVERFLDTATAVQSIGVALYRTMSGPEGNDTEAVTVSTGSSGKNAEHP